MLSDFVKAVVKVIEKERAGIAANMGDGACGDWAEYKKLVGKRSGLAQAIDIIKETERMTVDDEDRTD